MQWSLVHVLRGGSHEPSQQIRLPQTVGSVCSLAGHLLCAGDDYAEVREPDRQVLGPPILPREVLLEERIGEGQFGDVHKGVLYPGVSGCGFWFLWSVFVFLLSFPQ